MRCYTLQVFLHFNSFYDFDEKTFQWNYFSFNIQCSLSFHLTVIFLVVSQKCALCNSRKLKVLEKTKNLSKSPARARCAPIKTHFLFSIVPWWIFVRWNSSNLTIVVLEFLLSAMSCIEDFCIIQIRVERTNVFITWCSNINEGTKRIKLRKYSEILITKYIKFMYRKLATGAHADDRFQSVFQRLTFNDFNVNFNVKRSHN